MTSSPDASPVPDPAPSPRLPSNPLAEISYPTLGEAKNVGHVNPHAKPGEPLHGMMSPGFEQALPEPALPEKYAGMPGLAAPIGSVIPKKIGRLINHRQVQGPHTRRKAGALRQSLMGKPGDPLRPGFVRAPHKAARELWEDVRVGDKTAFIGATALHAVGVLAHIPGIPLAGIRAVGRKRKRPDYK